MVYELSANQQFANVGQLDRTCATCNVPHEGVIHEEGTLDEVLKHPRKERTRAFLTGFTGFNF
jgi:ABC-type histidine transport system ATPase subunit